MGLRRAFSRFILFLNIKGLTGLIKAVWRRLIPAVGKPFALLPTDKEYACWQADFEPDDTTLKAQVAQAQKCKYRPLVSVVMPVFAVAQNHLEQALDSLLQQTYPHWELDLTACEDDEPSTIQFLEAKAASDERIRLHRLPKNLGISVNSNHALSFARGEFITLMDDDDTLAPWALFEVVRLLNDHPEAELIYSDHDLLDEKSGIRSKPLFKPDWSPESLLSANYLTHLTVISAKTMNEVGGFDPGMDGAQDWNLFFRIIQHTERIFHIPQILYHWREHAHSTAGGIYTKEGAPAAQIRAITAYLQHLGLNNACAKFDSSGFLRSQWDFSPESVSIIIPSPGMPRHLVDCLESLFQLTDYPDFEVILVNTGRLLGSDLQRMEKIGAGKIKVINDPRQPFNYSSCNNLGVENTRGSLLLFMNNDIKIIEPGWLAEMVMWAQRVEIGAVGARLNYPTGLIQHNGAIIGLGGYAGHLFAGTVPGSWTLMGPTEWYRNFLAVTAACLMVRKDVFRRCGGFNPDFELCGGDMELCLRIRSMGLRNMVTPFAHLVHLESRSRKGVEIPAGDYRNSFPLYQPYLQSGDPAFNVNLSPWSTIPQLKKAGEIAPLEFVRNHLHALK